MPNELKSSVAGAPRAIGAGVILAAGVMLAACGQKGPLELPKPPVAASTPAR